MIKPLGFWWTKEYLTLKCNPRPLASLRFRKISAYTEAFFSIIDLLAIGITSMFDEVLETWGLEAWGGIWTVLENPLLKMLLFPLGNVESRLKLCKKSLFSFCQSSYKTLNFIKTKEAEQKERNGPSPKHVWISKSRPLFNQHSYSFPLKNVLNRSMHIAKCLQLIVNNLR